MYHVDLERERKYLIIFFFASFAIILISIALAIFIFAYTHPKVIIILKESILELYLKTTLTLMKLCGIEGKYVLINGRFFIINNKSIPVDFGIFGLRNYILSFVILTLIIKDNEAFLKSITLVLFVLPFMSSTLLFLMWINTPFINSSQHLIQILNGTFTLYLILFINMYCNYQTEKERIKLIKKTKIISYFLICYFIFIISNTFQI